MRMMNIYLIRHGMTKGNLEGRYVGATDEDLLESSVDSLCERSKLNSLPKVKKVYSSPMCRCMRTAEILCEGAEIVIVPELRECNFGEYEYRNYEELKYKTPYIEFIESEGMKPFPNGESREEFGNRCILAYENIVRENMENGETEIVIVAHGGTIMSIMEKMIDPHRGFYDWQLKCGEGYVIENVSDITLRGNLKCIYP